MACMSTLPSFSLPFTVGWRSQDGCMDGMARQGSGSFDQFWRRDQREVVNTYYLQQEIMSNVSSKHIRTTLHSRERKEAERDGYARMHRYDRLHDASSVEPPARTRGGHGPLCCACRVARMLSYSISLQATYSVSLSHVNSRPALCCLCKVSVCGLLSRDSFSPRLIFYIRTIYLFSLLSLSLLYLFGQTHNGAVWIRVAAGQYSCACCGDSLPDCTTRGDALLLALLEPYFWQREHVSRTNIAADYLNVDCWSFHTLGSIDTTC